jgi:hypothetical protein
VPCCVAGLRNLPASLKFPCLLQNLPVQKCVLLSVSGLGCSKVICNPKSSTRPVSHSPSCLQDFHKGQPHEGIIGALSSPLATSRSALNVWESQSDKGISSAGDHSAGALTFFGCSTDRWLDKNSAADWQPCPFVSIVFLLLLHHVL